MKYFYSLICFFVFTVFAFAQSPNRMSYQAVIRDAGNTLVTTQVGMQISILQGSDTGTAVYVETHTPTPNINGLVSLQIGTGTVVSGDITAIDWSNGPYFIKTETDPSGGTAYSISGASELLSVPYALYAENTASFQDNITQSINISSYGDCSIPFPDCGSGNLSIITSKKLAYSPGMRIRLSATTNVSDFIEGIVSSYDGSNMNIEIDTNRGSSSYDTWNINPGSGIPGFPGPVGLDGEPGGECFGYFFNTDTSNTEPFQGDLKQNGSSTSTTQIYISRQTNIGDDIGSYLNLIASSNNVVKAIVKLSNNSGFGANGANYYTIDNVTDNFSWYTLDVTYLSGSESFFGSDSINVCFSRAGDKGDSGLGSKNILGSIGASDPNTDVFIPNEGDEWVNSISGERYIYQAGVWNLLPSSDINSKNFLGTSSAVGPVEGTASVLPGMDRSPIEGDQWVDPVSAEFYIYTSAGWLLAPSSEIIAGNGLTKSGNSISAGGSSTIVANSDNLEVNSSSIPNQVLLSSGIVGTSAIYGALPLGDNNSTSGLLDATKIANGSVSNIEFQYLNGVTSNIQTQLDTKITPFSVDVLTNKTIDASANTITGLTKADVGLNNVQNTQINLSATTAPSANNDNTQGYTVGSIWIDVNGNSVYMCVNSTSGAAVWVQLNN